jgi:hypothetical protein
MRSMRRVSLFRPDKVATCAPSIHKARLPLLAPDAVDACQSNSTMCGASLTTIGAV